MEKESWLPVINNFPYEVSSHGRVRRTTTKASGMAGWILKPVLSGPGGYLRVTLSNGKPKIYCVHFLVCSSFHGMKPPEKSSVAHIDGDRFNNHASNLYWATHRENAADKSRHGRMVRGTKHPLAKLTDEQVLIIREKRRAGITCKSLSAEFGVAVSLVHRIGRKVAWPHI